VIKPGLSLCGLALVWTAAARLSEPQARSAPGAAQAYTQRFAVEKADLGPTGRNPYFVLEPGYQLVLAGKEDGARVELVITVLDEIREVDGVQTRVVEGASPRTGSSPATPARGSRAPKERPSA
jgi:hypothetical protein